MRISLSTRVVLVVPVEPEKDAAAKPSGKYLPPGARRAAAGGTATGGSSAGSGPGSRRKKVAPNFNSQDDFPSLGAALNEQGYDQKSVIH